METESRVEDGWFKEVCAMWEGVSLALQVEKTLFSKRSEFQQIDLYQTKNYGKMLVLDGIIQLTERDEFTYQEMMANMPLMSHPDPRSVLVVGGGDGGILREIGRHKNVEVIDFCEIDEMVVQVSKQFLPTLACGFDDPRVTVHIQDGNLFVQEHPNTYDVIIVDSSDPIGPGEVLFKKPFYKGLKNALKPGGIIATQGESYFLHQDHVMNLVQITRELFDQQAYATILVPTYPGGHICICMASLGPRFGKPLRSLPQALQGQLKYYSPEVHEAAFVLPYFVRQLMDD